MAVIKHLWDYQPGVEDTIECDTCGYFFDTYVTRSFFRFYDSVCCLGCNHPVGIELEDYESLLQEVELPKRKP